MRWLYQLVFSLCGWRIIGAPPALDKYIIAVAPHSSNIDFLLGLAVRSIQRFRCSYLAKSELFVPPLGWLMRRLGGIPVYRGKHLNVVEQIALIAKKRDHFILAIAPEGTRKKVDRWKTGFYNMAVGAGIPIVFAAVDYPTKTVTWSAPLYPCGDLVKDAVFIDRFFEGKRGKYHEAAKVLG
jgi:1-acyl-sn-glycerol-3-phosphate acyltransferase